MEVANNKLPCLTSKNNNLTALMLMALIMVLLAGFFCSFWVKIFFFLLLILVFLLVIFDDSKKGILFFAASLAFAPPLYLIAPVHFIFRSIRLYEVLLCIILIFVLLQTLKSEKRFFHKTLFDVPILCMLGIWMLSVFNGIYLQQDFYLRDFFEFLKPIRLFLILQIVIFLVKEKEYAKKLLSFLVVFSIFPQLLGIGEHFNLLGIRRFIATTYTGYEYSSIIAGGFDVYGAGFLHKFRTSSIFVGDVNAFGGYSAIFFIMAFIFFMYVPKIKSKILFSLIALLNFYGVIVSGSRKSLICVVFGILLFLLFKIRKLLKAVPLVIIGVLIILKLAPGYYLERFFFHWDYKINNILRLFSQFSEFGIAESLIGRGTMHEFGADSFHLKLLIRNGLLGLIAHFVLVFVMLKIAFFVIKHSKHWFDEMIGVMALILIINMEWLNVTGLYFYAGRISESFWIVLGVLYAVYRNIRADNLQLIGAKGLN
ncbi:MAG: hypothetical protein ABII88_06995 [Candidatus Omnitrophota bacterium]